jgi:hypothetical protein
MTRQAEPGARPAWAITWLALALAAGAGNAWAIAAPESGATVAAPGPAAAAARPAASSPTESALSLVPGRIESVDTAAGTIVLHGGMPVPLHPTQLRVLGPRGQPLAGVRALRAGMAVRVALEPEPAVKAAAVPGLRASAPSAPPPRRIVLIYVEAS